MLCAVHRDFHGDFPPNFPAAPTARSKDATDINTYLSENLSGIKVTQIFGREDEKMAEFREKSQRLAKANQEQIFVFGVFRRWCICYFICSILSVLPGRHGPT